MRGADQVFDQAVGESVKAREVVLGTLQHGIGGHTFTGEIARTFTAGGALRVLGRGQALDDLPHAIE